MFETDQPFSFSLVVYKIALVMDPKVKLRQNGPLSTLTDVELDNMIMSAEVFGRLVSMMIRMGHSVNCKLDRCSIEPEEDARQEEVDMENQPVFQMMTQSASPEYTTDVTLRNVTMSAGVFRRVVNMVIQSGHPVNWELWFCSIEHKEDARHMTMKNQPTLQMVAPDLASLDYSTHITLRSMTMSAGVFRRLVSMVVRSGHSVNCELWFCTIEPEEDERQLQVDMENQHALQMGALQPASPGFTTHISLSWMTISTGVFRRLISMLVQSRHSINCTFRVCKITTEEDVRQLEGEMKNKSALQVVVPQSALPEYTTSIKTDGVTMSAETFRCLLSIVIHSGHSVDCQLQNCKIEPEADVKQLLEEMENQPALKVTELIDDKVSDFKKWHIEFKINE
ncbi:hypothetical protein MAR_007518 [Mya arenaria]|uniref:Uncharacterized protein n=1 Tax=Mya arenaria TaxID=6604 RepID=A0ABY7DBK4_MYAAR|nr:hypothetical protein MAR_007518 [Mya arenaria]